MSRIHSSPLGRTLTTRQVVLTAALAALFVASSAGAAQAQVEHKAGGNEGKVPIGWQSRVDGGTDQHGSADTLSFVQMTPGYHVTTGPAVILWANDSTASGSFTIDATIFLFPTKGRDQEGYGIFVGGSDLTGGGQGYTYFLLRNDGRFLVKQRRGAATSVLKDWTPLAAIKRQAAEDAERNDFRIAVTATTVTFSVNGQEAASFPRGQVAPDGIYGLRLNHAVNAHVSKVSRGR